MSKTNSYQKLKEENKRLRNELYELVINPNSIESLYIKHSFNIKVSLAKINFKSGLIGNGIYDNISKK